MNKSLFLLSFIFILFLSCSFSVEKEIVPEPDQNEITFQLSNVSSSLISDGDYYLELTSLNALQGNYSGIDIVFSGEDEEYKYEFNIHLPENELFSVYVGLCTAQGCEVNYIAPDSFFQLTDEDYMNLYDLSGDNQIYAKMILYIREKDGSIVDSLIFTDFNFDVSAFTIEDNIIKFICFLEGTTEGEENTEIKASFIIEDKKIDYIFVE